jgi:hypothetical protein
VLGVDKPRIGRDSSGRIDEVGRRVDFLFECRMLRSHARRWPGTNTGGGMGWFGDRSGIMAVFLMGYFLWEGRTYRHWNRWTLWLFPPCALLLLYYDYVDETPEGLQAYWYAPLLAPIVFIVHFAVWMNSDLDPASRGGPARLYRGPGGGGAPGWRAAKRPDEVVMGPRTGPMSALIGTAIDAMSTKTAEMDPAPRRRGYCASFASVDDASAWVQVVDGVLNVAYRWSDEPLPRLRTAVRSFPSETTCTDWQPNSYATIEIPHMEPEKMAEFVARVFVDLHGLTQDARITAEVFLFGGRA